MSWQDRDYGREGGAGFGRPGGDWQGIRPTFDNPMTWSVPMGRISGITVRAHIIFLLYILIQLAQSLGSPATGATFSIDFKLTAAMLGALFLVVLLHEFGHCLACRRVGGQADEILMWPLGGLAYCMPPHHWKAHLWTVVGGPAVNVVVCLLVTPMIGIVSGRWLGVALPNPFDPGYGLRVLSMSWPMMILFMLNWISLILLIFNLLPIFPLDGGRMVQALLWPRKGYVRSMRIAVRTGYVGAIVLGVFGAVEREWLLVGIAIFGGVTCYMTYRQLQFTEDFMGYESDDVMQLHQGPMGETEPRRPDRRERRREREAQRRAEQLARESREVDEILRKIAEQGMDSLTTREKRILRRETERKKSQDGR